MEFNASSQRSGRALLSLVAMFACPLAASAQAVPACPDLPLELGAAGPALDFRFGTGPDRNMGDLLALASEFEPRSSNWGDGTINNEWQRYADFNRDNHHFTADRLELVALNERADGSVAPGEISSAELASLDHFHPTNGQSLIFQLRAKIPHGEGTWPAFWLYSPGGETSTDSEIDIFEFWNNTTQDTHDWTGYDHGPGAGADLCSNMTNEWVWSPGIDFADDYHVYSLVWSEGVIEKWVDNTLVKRSDFVWSGPAPQILINLAIGGNDIEDPTAGTFPSVFSLDYFRVFIR